MCVFRGAFGVEKQAGFFLFFPGGHENSKGHFSRHKRKRMFCIPLRNKNAGRICAKSAPQGNLFDYKA